MVVLIVAIFVALAIAAPIFGYDSRVLDPGRAIRWWPGEREVDLGPQRRMREVRPARAHRPRDGRRMVDTRAA